MKVECEIIPTNKRLKQLIKEFGETWNAISPVRAVACFDGRLGVKVESLCGKHARWVEYPQEIYFK